MLFFILFVIIIAVITYKAPCAGIAIAGQAYLIRNAVYPGEGGMEQEDPLIGIGIPLLVFWIVILQSLFWKVPSKYKFCKVDFWLILLGIIQLIGVFYAPNPQRALELCARYWILGFGFYLMMRFILLYYDYKEGIGIYLKTIWLIALALAAVALANPEFAESTRASVAGSNPIPFSLLIGSGILINVYWLLTLSRSKISLMIGLCTASLLAYVFVASNTRGTTISLIISLSLVIGLLLWTKGFQRYFIKIAFGLIIVVVLLVYWQKSEPERLETLGSGLQQIVSKEKAGSLQERSSAYSTAAALFGKHPLIGVGTGGFAFYHYLAYPHNLELEVAAENGIIGLVALGGLILSIVNYGMIAIKNSKKSDDFLAILLVGIILYVFLEAQFSFRLWMHKNLYLTMALLISMVVSKNYSDISKIESYEPVK